MKKIFLVIFSSVLLLALGLGLALPGINAALKNEKVRNALIQKIADSLDGTLETDSLAIAMDRRKIQIRGSKIEGNLLNNTLDISIPDLELNIRYSDLLRASFFPDVVKASAPVIKYRPLGGDVGFQLLEKDNWAREVNDLLEKIFGHGSRIEITNATVDAGGIRLLGLFISSSQKNYQTTLQLTTELGYRNTRIPVKINAFTVNPFAQPFSSAFTIDARGIPLALLPGSRDFFFSNGLVDVSAKLHGERDEITVDAGLSIDNLDMSVGWTSDDGTIHLEKPYRIQRLDVDLQGGLKGKKLDFSSLALKSHDFRLTGSLLFDFASVQDPFMDLRLQSGEMELATLKMLLPDPLINDWTTQTIFPRLENGTAYMDSLVLRGSLSELARLDEPQYVHGLAWSGTLRNVDTFYNDHRKLARVESVNLSMDGDELKIEQLKARAGTSELDRGDIIISDLYDPSLQLKADIDGNFDASWLIRMARAGLVGDELKSLSSRAGKVSGRIKSRLSLAAEVGEDITLLSLDGTGTMEQLRVQAKQTILPLQLKKSKFTLKYPGTSTLNGKGLWGKSPFSAVLTLGNLDEKQHLKLTARPDLAELKKTFSSNETITSLAPCMGSLPLSADISLYKSTLTATGTIDFAKPAAADDSLACSQIIAANILQKGSYKLQQKGGRTEIKNLTLKTARGTAVLNGRLQKKKKETTFTRARLKLDSFPLQALDILMPKHNKLLQGSVDADIKADTLDPEDIWPDLSGRITVTGWHGVFDYHPLTVTSMDLDIRLDRGRVLIDGDDIYVKDFTMDSPISLQAEFVKEKLWNGIIRLHAPMLDMSSTPSHFRYGKTDTPVHLPIGRVTILAGVDHAWYNNIVFSPFFIQTEAVGDRFFISQGVIKLNENFIWVSGKLNEKTNAVYYESYFKIRGQPVETFLKLYGFENNRISGSLDLEGKMIAGLKPGETVFEKTSGPLYFEIKDGFLSSSSTLVKILDLLSLENIFEKKDVLQWKDRFKYNLIQGRFDLDRGIFTTSSLIMDSPVFDLFAEGKLDIPHDTIAMKVKLAPFGTISKILSSIPFFGYVFTGKTKSLIDYTLSVQGKIDDPEVKYVPLAGTFESLTGYLKRVVTRREEVRKDVNDAVEENMARQKEFIGFMQRELAPLHQRSGQGRFQMEKQP